MASSLSPKKFYSKNLPNAKLLKKEKQLKELFLPTLFSPSFSDDLLCRCWRVYRSQQNALEFIKTMKGVHVFSFESNTFQENSGQRLFLATSYEEFWHNYIQLKEELRTHYEVIPENRPCHLYFDIEYSYEYNPTKNGNEMVEHFVKFVCFCLEKYGIECEQMNFLVLASHSPYKFSRHIIVRLPNNVAFKNNFEAGAFVKHICNEYKSGPSGDEQVARGNLLVRDRSEVENVFCDLGVYSKNRNFRLYLSSKRGKASPLELALENHFPLSTQASDAWAYHKEIFMASLVCNVSKDARLLLFGNDGLKCLQDDSNTPQLGGNTNKDTKNHLRLGTEASILPFSREHPTNLDEFITSLIQTGGVEGRIYRKSMKKESNLIIYDIIKNRWCRNVGRFHKSNNVRMLVDPRKRVWFQKCHDPDCQSTNYKSPEFNIPENIVIEEESILSPNEMRVTNMNDSFPLSEEEWDMVFSHPFEAPSITFDADMQDVSSGLVADIGSEALMDILNCELTESCETSCHVNESDFGRINPTENEVSDEDILNVLL